MRYVKGGIYFPIIVGIHFVLWAIDLRRPVLRLAGFTVKNVLFVEAPPTQQWNGREKSSVLLCQQIRNI